MPVKNLVQALIAFYPINGYFKFDIGPIETAPARLNAASYLVPNTPGLYFIYGPNPGIWQNSQRLTEGINGENYCLINVGKAGMDLNGQDNTQGIHGRINNVGKVGNGYIKRSKIWTKQMLEKGVNNFLFKWVQTGPIGGPFNNCAIIENSFYELWRAIPEIKPEQNRIRGRAGRAN